MAWRSIAPKAPYLRNCLWLSDGWFASPGRTPRISISTPHHANLKTSALCDGRFVEVLLPAMKPGAVSLKACLCSKGHGIDADLKSLWAC
jgi:hypothetical protein